MSLYEHVKILVISSMRCALDSTFVRKAAIIIVLIYYQVTGIVLIRESISSASLSSSSRYPLFSQPYTHTIDTFV